MCFLICPSYFGGAGPAPAQAAPTQEALAAASTFEQIPDKLKEFGNTLEDKARAAIEHIKQSDFAVKTRLGPSRGAVRGTWG